jgi:hypothetical protein
VARELDLAEAKILLDAAARRRAQTGKAAADPLTPALERRVADLEGTVKQLRDVVTKQQIELDGLKPKKGAGGRGFSPRRP